jgi:hypothetical protein
LSIFQVSGHQKKFPGRKVGIRATERTREAGKDCESSVRRGLTRPMEIPFLDFEQRVPNQHVAFGPEQFRLNIVEIDGLQRLLDMQLSRLAFVIDAVPIKHAVRGVAVLLNLD